MATAPLRSGFAETVRAVACWAARSGTGSGRGRRSWGGRRNAVYSGPWVTDAKRHFSKNGCPAYAIGSDYMSGAPIRQDYLETVIEWINDGDIESYMAKQQHKPNANDLWL